ncbi:hypothetical protein HID58_027673 [Brassica napus]|uniref:Legume lectin domain-containing protein n=1 Tax=Brassica napus TaxID=3708 RepID=A0ABQ8CSM6_BRANA|nr:hypothetical protein HID58_027673 [Brassica napus]
METALDFIALCLRLLLRPARCLGQTFASFSVSSFVTLASSSLHVMSFAPATGTIYTNGPYRAQEDVGRLEISVNNRKSSPFAAPSRIFTLVNQGKAPPYSALTPNNTHIPLSMALSTFSFQSLDSNRLSFQTNLEAIINKPFVDFSESSFTEISLDVQETFSETSNTLGFGTGFGHTIDLKQWYHPLFSPLG